MRRRWLATMLVTITAAAACSPAKVPPQAGPSGTPLPDIVSPASDPPGNQGPGAGAPATGGPTRPDPNAVPGAANPLDCMGAVIYRVDALDARSSKTSVCIAVGGVVRVENLGPGNLSTDPADRVSCLYDAGITDCRLIRTGLVTFKSNGTPKVGPLMVTVAEASSPPKPSPACLSATTYTIDASEGGPPWPSLCVKLDVILRVENLGPDGFSADPAGIVSCRYEAGVRECRFAKASTVTIRTSRSGQTRSLIVVAVN